MKVGAVEVPTEAAMSANGTSRHSPRRTISGRYWVYSGQTKPSALISSVANDPTATFGADRLRLGNGQSDRRQVKAIRRRTNGGRLSRASAIEVFNAPTKTRFIVSANVDTVNDNPRAWTSSSFSSPMACRYGTAGMTKTPVAAVISPVTAPTIGPSHGSCSLVAVRRTEATPVSA